MTMQDIQPIQAQHYLEAKELAAHLEGVEYIIMAAPAMGENLPHPIHFTLFLNTTDKLPGTIAQQVLEKFAAEHNIKAISHVQSALSEVAFAQTRQTTPMPMHLIKPDDKASLPHTTMYVIDFLGDSPDFKEPKEGLTGWSYAYT